MSKVAIITDSSPYIPQDLVNDHNIHVIPLLVIWGEDTLKDGVDIVPGEFYNRLENAEIMPSTSQPPVPVFEKAFRELHNQGYEILAIFISDKLSGTISSATQAKKLIPEAKIEIIDSESIAMALGFQVLAAARAARNGDSLEKCKHIAEKVREQTGVVFVVDTLEFLHRGGRIGSAKRFLGTMLNMKPVLAIENGEVVPIAQVRTQRKALAELVEIIQEHAQGHSKIHLASLHANNQKIALNTFEKALKRVPAIEVVHSEVSPVVGTHAGPGALGIAYWFEE